VLVWHQSDGEVERAYARERRADGILGVRQTLSDADLEAKSVQVAVAPDGRAVFGWARGADDVYVVQARARSADGTLSPVQSLSRPDEYASEVDVGVSDAGAAVLSWRLVEDDTIWTRARAASGALAAAQRVSAAAVDAYRPQIAVDAAGGASYAWLQWDPAGSVYRAVLRSRAAGGALSPIKVRSTPEYGVDDPQVAVNGGGQAAAVYPERTPFSAGCFGCDRINVTAGP
jgi:hypothetical protein